MKKKLNLRWKHPQKLCVFLATWLICLCPIMLVAQKITVHIGQGTLDQAFQQIMKSSDVEIVYNTDLAANIKCSAATYNQQEISDILTTLLQGTSLQFRNKNGIYLITSKSTQQQRGKITGKVLDKDGSPIPGVAIIIKGTYNGAATDIDGKFEIQNLQDSVFTLVASYVGMKTKEIQVNINTNIVIRMEEETKDLEEVVITGYQTIKHEKVTGSTTTVTSRQLEERYTTNLLNNLEGRVAGLVTYGDKTLIRGSSSMHAETNPLLVVDGLPIEGKIEDLNPYDIESVTVLKDAAATAIYGARASNGVIVITTKKATKEGTTEVTFSGTLSIYEKQNMNYHDNFYMNPAEQVDFESAYWDYYYSDANTDTTDPIASFESSLNSYGTITPLQYAYYLRATGELSDTDLEAYKEELRQNNFAKEFGKHALKRQLLQQYNLAIRTRTEKLNSSLVFNLKRDNNGIINSYDNQLNISFKISYDVKKWLTANFNFNSILSKTKESARSWCTTPFNVPAYYRLLNDDGSYNYYSTNFNQYYTLDDENPALKSMDFNHLEDLGMDSEITDNRNMRYQGELLFKVIDGLTINSSFVYETERKNISNYSEADSYVMRFLRNVYTTQSGTDPNYTYTYMIPEQGGKLTTQDTRGEYWTIRGQLNFQRTFAEKHAVDFIGGFEFRETKSNGTKGILLGYDDQLQSHATTTVSFPDLNNYTYTTFFAPGYSALSCYNVYINPYLDIIQEQWHRYASGYVNLTYTYDNRYNAFASFRKDYADLFGANAKFRGKPLWSVGLSWNIGYEDFMQDVKWLNSLKLRTSYGKTGNIYQGATSYMTASTGTLNYYTNMQKASIDSPANPNLKWEKTATTNIGVDFSLFGYRLRGSFDYYYKKGTDIFSQKTLDVSKGFTSMNMNMANMKNNGVEITLSYDWFRADKEGGFSWTSSMTAAYNKNEITSMEVQATTASSLAGTSFQTGYPTSALFSYRYAGLDQTGETTELGQPTWYTEDGSKVGTTIMSEDISALVYSGQTDPKVNVALDNTLRYKGFNLNFMMVYYGGHKMRAREYLQISALPYGAATDYLLNSWTPENTDTDVPGFGQYGPKNNSNVSHQYSDLFVRPADFIKIRNITFGYSVPESLTRQIGMENLRLTFQIDNIPALWKKNNVGIDPETLGIRNRMKYIIGLNFNF